MKSILAKLLCLPALLLASVGVLSADEMFPSKPITVIVPWKPGGGTDVLARAIAPVWEKELGVPLVIQNKPGGNNIVGYKAMFDAPADGYTLVLGQSPNYNMNVHFQNAPYAIEDIVFLNLFQKDDPIFYVNKDAPWTNLADLIADAKSRPGEIKIGVVSSKGMDVVYLQDFEKRAGIKLGEAIPMGGGGPLRREVVGGHINLAFHAAWVARKAQGLVRAIGIRSLKPSPIWPEAQLFNDVLPEANRYTEKDITTLPTFIKGFAVSATTRENHPDRVKTLVDSFERAMQSPEWTEMVAKQQLETALDYHSMAKTSEIVAAFSAQMMEYKHLFQN
jgi:tripartite-type tricarboxylate transporter receptor subunit TctC